jgi:hypothetical protein
MGGQGGFNFDVFRHGYSFAADIGRACMNLPNGEGYFEKGVVVIARIRTGRKSPFGNL